MSTAGGPGCAQFVTGASPAAPASSPPILIDPLADRLPSDPCPPVPPPDPLLATDNLRLHLWQAADLPALFTEFSDPDTVRFSWASPDPYTEADAQKYLTARDHGRRRGEQLRPALVALDNPTLDDPTAGPDSTGPGHTGPDSCIDAELILSWAVATSLHRLPTTPQDSTRCCWPAPRASSTPSASKRCSRPWSSTASMSGCSALRYRIRCC
jgi:hypothetical protein